MSESRRTGDVVIEAAAETVRVSLEAAASVARFALETGSETANEVQARIREALDALRRSHGEQR